MDMHEILGSELISAYGWEALLPEPELASEFLRRRAPRVGLLAIRFCDGATWWYAGVPESVLADFLMAESRGAFFRRHIRPFFEGRVADDPGSA